MALRYIDLETGPDLAEVLKDVRKSHEPVTLREAGEEIAVISPPKTAPVGIVRSEEERQALLSVAGSWAEVDADQLIKYIYEQRLVSTRPPVER